MTRQGIPQREAADKRLIDAVRSFGKRGATRPELAGHLGFDASSGTKIGARLRRLVEEGRLGTWPDPLPNSRKRARYWTPEFLPETCPEPTRAPSGGGHLVAAPAGDVPIEQRYSVQIPAGYVSALDSSQCRPWATAAAQLIGGARG